MTSMLSWACPLCIIVLGGISSVALAGTEEGEASYYADRLNGNKTASGELYDKNAMTAAHRTLEFGTNVTVTLVDTGKSVDVRINDRGPYADDRIIDLSGAAAEELGIKKAGTGKIRLEYAD